MKTVTIRLYASLKERAGFSDCSFEIPDEANLRTLKNMLERQYPKLRSQLDNVLVLIGSTSAVEEDIIPAEAVVSFLTPIGGG